VLVDVIGPSSVHPRVSRLSPGPLLLGFRNLPRRRASERSGLACGGPPRLIELVLEEAFLLLQLLDPDAQGRVLRLQFGDLFAKSQELFLESEDVHGCLRRRGCC